MGVLYKKLRNLKTHLRDFNKIEFGNVHAQVTDIQHELAQVQSTLMDSACGSPEAIKKETDLRVKLLVALDREEKLLKQKSMVEWLRAGDQNTSFFQKAVRGRMAHSTIRVLYSTSGTKLEGVQEIKDEAIKFFEGLLRRKDECISVVLASKLSSILKRKVHIPKYQLLISPIADEEIKKALFSMGNDKSPGPDGFIAFFFKHAWHTVQNDFTRAVKHFFSTGILQSEAWSLPSIKIDLMKAFDSLSWDFILNSLEAMGFPPNFLWWIKGCITSPYFSVAINGSLAGYFPGQRGVRQGHPLSPYLFVIAMEVFSQIMDLAVIEGKVGYHPRCRVQLINSVLFSMANYWCHHFILPKKVIKLVHQKCRSFLWKGLEQHAGGNNINWETVCLPKAEGGLGIKDLSLWNKERSPLFPYSWRARTGERCSDGWYMVLAKNFRPSSPPDPGHGCSTRTFPSGQGLLDPSQVGAVPFFYCLEVFTSHKSKN
ncbi:hypothetical protein CRG98_017537 [Punica granatum]|uniref:Reverse transcriptase domain-containing protein n=1 Tax=Punica granatum TaxID=22663 RepID=A0A2I0K0R3_PUNGR|nr:hypothetical protein CRG98_017537 [Punica granatum]